MKHLIKNIAVTTFSVLFILLSIKPSYAEESYKLVNISPLSTKSIELEFDNTINRKITNDTDLEIYKSIKSTPKKDVENSKKVTLELGSNIEANTSYSLISISSVEGDIVFTTGTDILGKKIINNDFDDNYQGIKSILVKTVNTIELTFSENISSDDLEFQLFKTLEVKEINNILGTNKITAVLKKEIDNNTEYLGTLTYIKNIDSEKTTIDKGIYYFETNELEVYVATPDLNDENILVEDVNLKDTLLEALGKESDISKDNLLDGEKELQEELNSASDDPENIPKTQLEELALSQTETPDTGAETWILLFATFIINTFYFLSRRKKA